MPEAGSGYEYLDMLRRQNGKQTQSFTDFSVYLEARARKAGIPIHGQFELTPLCNLDCGMCYVHLNGDQLKGKPLLAPDDWKALIRQAFDAGMYQATLTGGECLTYPGFEDVYLYLHSLGCEADILTNGVLLDEPRIRFFEDHPPALIQITLYGQNDDVYQRVTGRRVFRQVMENIHRVREAGFPLSITVTPNQYLGEDVFETVRLAAELTESVFINTSLFVPPEEPWREKNIEDPDLTLYAKVLRFYRELRGEAPRPCPESELPVPGGPCQACQEKGLRCGGGRSGFTISWQGEMRICNRLAPKGYPLRDGFAEAWRFIHEAAVTWPRAPECVGCAYEKVCSSCAAEAMKYAEPGKKPEGLCKRTKYMVSQGILPVSHCDLKEMQ